ncbi:MAG: DUF6351 family protein [Pseudohongiellaceae bacterium]
MYAFTIRTTMCIFLLSLILSCSTDEPVSTSGMLNEISQVEPFKLSVISSKSWLVSGGDALVELNGAEDASLLPFTVDLNGADISDLFIQVSGSRRQALLSSLPEGDSTLVVESPSTGTSSTLTLTNYPNSGPMISGPHQTPFVCQSAEFQLATGELLGASYDANCFVEPRVDYVYWSETEENFKPYSLAMDDSVPEDMGFLGDQSEIPFIVRVETGTVNRAIYEIAMLHDPAEGLLSPWRQSNGWNKKLVFTHGGGCRSGWHQQGVATGGVLNPGLLQMGYALMSSTLNVFGQNCNDLLASETHIMLKELFIEHYGMPLYTVATGVSGGSYQSHQTADNYPGVFDGIIVGLSFPDVTSATIFTLADARLLHYYFEEINPDGFSEEEELAVSGFAEHASIANLSRGAARLDPLFTETASLEEQGSEFSLEELAEQRYSSDNPNGLRATVYDHSVNVYGTVADSNAAARPLDNEGVQYGLDALNSGTITAQQFVDLNRDVGGFDRDFNHVSARTRADAAAAEIAIESGRILYGGAGLSRTPIIDYRSYLDRREGGDIHMIVHQFATRQRLINANGNADNQVMQVGGRWGFSEAEPDLGVLFEQMDQWLLGIQGDGQSMSDGQRLRANKPPALADACWNNDSSPRTKIVQRQSSLGDSECAQLYPVYSTPRQVAGAPLSNDIVSCVLKPIDFDDYAVEFDIEQKEALSQVFPAGVCDWDAPDKHRATHQGTWQSFGPSPVNRVTK